MKRKITFLAAALMLVAFLIPPLAMRGQTRTEVEATWTASEQGYANATDVTDITIDENISGTFAKASGSNAPKYYTTGEAVRMYNGNTLTITPSSDSEITEIEFTLSQSGGFTVSTGEYSVEGSTGTWTGSSTEAIVFTNGSSQNRIQVIKVTYTTSGAPTPIYTLTFSATPEEGGTVTVGNNTTGSIDLAEGAERTITATANSGYVFSNWTVTGEGSSVADEDEATTTFIMGTEDATLTANFTAVATYTVTYKANGPEADDVVETYNEGENVTVAANTFNYAQHAFTKWNTLEGGTGTDYMPGDVIENISANIDLYAQWVESNETVDVLNWEATGSPTNYTDWTYTGTSGAVYKGQSSGTYQSIQLRSNNNNSGIVTTGTGGLATKVAVTWNSNTADGRTLNVYGSNTAYSAATDLYGDNAGTLIGTIVCGTSTELTFETSYPYIGMRSANSAMYLDEIDITWVPDDNPAPVINIENNEELAYDATSGSFTFTISNPVEGATLSVLEEVDWIDEAEINNLPDGYSVTFATTVNEGVAREGVITLTYNYNRDVVTKTVTVTQAGNPNAPGTENNPYTVAQAIEAINAGAGTEGVYATGVVSEIVTPYSTQYSNITFDFIDEGNTEAFLRAYRCVGEDAANVEVGDVVVVYGNLTQYDELYEFAQGCSIVSLTHPVSTDPSITFTYNESPYTPTDVYHIELPCDVSGGYVAHVVSENFQTSLVASDFHVEFCDVNGDALPVDPDWLEFVRVTLMPEWAQDETLYLEVSAYANETDESRTAYFKVWALNGNDMVYSSIVTITQAEYVVDYATLPFEFNGGSANIENTNGLTQEGLGSDYNTSPKLKFDGTGDWMILKFNETPGTLTFDIKGNSFSGGTFTVQTSEDGVTYSDLQAYTELGNTQSESFDNLGENVRYIKWIYTEKGSGNVALGNIMLYQYGAGPVVPASITVSPATVNEDSYEHDGTLALSYENLTISDMSDFGIQYYDAEGAETTGPDWIEVLVAEQNPTTGEGYVVSYYMLANEGEARSAYFKVFAMGDEDFVYSNLVTINQAAYVAPFVTTNYTLATAIESGRHYIITNGTDKAMGQQNTNNRPAVESSINEGVASVASADVYEFVINGPDANGFYTIYDAEVPGYLYAASSSANQLKTRTFNTDANSQWTITFGEENNAIITAQGSNSRNLMRYNNGSSIFSCYASGQQNIYLYMKDEDTPQYDFYKDITGFGEAENGNYYLIASPVADANVRLATTGDYDLYAYDEPTHHWLNQKVADNNITTFVSGQGYLYANKVNKTLHFEGEPNTSSDVTLTKTEGISLSGMNLVGNPFSVPAYINRAFYVMNAEGTEFVVAERNAINPMEGVFVEAASNGETLTFSTEAPASSNSSLSLNLRQTVANRGGASTGSATTIDRAIIRFGESQSLPKFMLNENNTKLYIPQGEKDYAMVSNEGQGELPVNFKAAENGSYTLCVNTENVEMDYLHLIDNMTGADVDLLLTPSYTFEASTRDYATRFRLVFSTNSVNENAEGNANFAFFDGNEWVINSTNNATLQVVDLMGRILSSETFSGSYERKLNAAPGVYMLRLINGNDVKVQKIVVR